MRSSRATPVIALAMLAMASSPLRAQQDSLATQAKVRRGPSQHELLFSATGGAAMSGVAGVVASWVVYSIACDENDSSKAGWFGPCLFPSEEAVAIGWYGGSFGGATGLATMVAVQRGCPPEQAFWRATLGAAAGVLPGLIARNTRLSRVPGGRQDLAIATPLVAGLGAYLTTVGCRD